MDIHHPSLAKLTKSDLGGNGKNDKSLYRTLLTVSSKRSSFYHHLDIKCLRSTTGVRDEKSFENVKNCGPLLTKQTKTKTE